MKIRLITVGGFFRVFQDVGIKQKRFYKNPVKVWNYWANSFPLWLACKSSKVELIEKLCKIIINQFSSGFDVKKTPPRL